MSSARTRPCEEEVIQSTSLAVNRPAAAKPWVLLASILASSVANIDESIVNVVLSAIETDVATSAVVVQWSLTPTRCAYQLFFWWAARAATSSAGVGFLSRESASLPRRRSGVGWPPVSPN